MKEVITLYREALQGKRSGTSVWRALKATNQLGVTRGQLTKANHSDKTLQKNEISGLKAFCHTPKIETRNNGMYGYGSFLLLSC
ncbi:hypothetical protein GCM10020331_058990 [Ectobacillus funiculus]